MSGDGVSLTNIAHPTGPWYKRLMFWRLWGKPDKESLETIEIEFPDRIGIISFDQWYDRLLEFDRFFDILPPKESCRDFYLDSLTPRQAYQRMLNDDQGMMNHESPRNLKRD